MKPDDARRLADEFVGKLERWHREQDRGPLARLRRGLSDATRHDAWMVLGQHFGSGAIDNRVYETVGACFALHPFPESPPIGNLGQTLRQVMGDKMRDDKEPHARFRRLLACSSREEICRHVPHAVRLARSKDVPVGYRQLFVDLWWWSDRTKLDWSRSYWGVRADDDLFSLAGAGAPVDDEEAPLEPE